MSSAKPSSETAPTVTKQKDAPIAQGEAGQVREATVCMLTSVHSATDVRIYEKEARSLSVAGYRVLIVAPHEKNDSREDVQIIAVRPQGSRLRRMTQGVWDVYRKAVEIDAEVYHFHDPELIPVGLLLRLHGKHVIYDVHEDVPRDILSKYWVWDPLRRSLGVAAEFAEAVGARSFDGICAATPAIARRFPSPKTEVIRNYPRLDIQANLGAIPYGQRAAICLYVGVVGVGRGAKEMIDSIALVPEHVNARLVLAGSYDPPGLEVEFHARPGWSRVDSVGWVSRSGVVELLGRAKVGLAILHPTACFVESLPVKMFEYMAAGIPLVVSDFPLWRRIVGDVGCGLLVDPLNPVDIARAIGWIFTHPQEAEEMGKRGAAAVRSTYNWEQESEKLLKFYRGLTNGCRTSSL